MLMRPEQSHYVPGIVLSAQPGSSEDGRPHCPSALSGAAGRHRGAPVPLGSATVLWPGRPWPGAEHTGALGLGCFHPALGSQRQPMLQGRGAGQGLLTPALQPDTALGGLPPSQTSTGSSAPPPHHLPDEFFVFFSCFLQASRDPASPLPLPHLIFQTHCPRSCLGSSFC